MHAAHSLMACWDDHESANNPWTGGAQNHQGESEGDWAARRAASIQAYYEWMPVREPEWLDTPGRSRMQRSEEHTSELQSLMRISYDVFCLKTHTTDHT